MAHDNALLEISLQEAGLALSKIAALVGAHLLPASLSRHIAAKARAQLKGLEAFIRRLLLWKALALEHEITPDMHEAAPRQNAPGRKHIASAFALFEPQCARADLPEFSQFTRPPARPLPAAPFLARIKSLQSILEAPDAYARRMAFSLARQREDQYTVLPGIGLSLRTLSAQLAALFQALGEPVFNACLARQPRVGPRPRPPPRIRQL